MYKYCKQALAPLRMRMPALWAWIRIRSACSCKRSEIEWI